MSSTGRKQVELIRAWHCLAGLFVFLPVVFLLFVLFLLAPLGCRSSKKTENEAEPPPKKIDGDSVYRDAQREFKKQNFAKAAELALNALDHELKLYSRSTVLQLLGQSFRHQGKYKEALEAFALAVEADPKNHEAHIFTGVVYRLQKKYAKANNAYEAALRIKPDSPTLHISIGALAIFTKKFQKAVDHLKTAIEFDPTNPVAHSNLALAYANLDQFADAQASLRSAELLGYKKTEVVQAQIDLLRLAAIKRGVLINE